MRPSTRMFLAAFRSRSWVRPHSVQVHDLTARGFLAELNPHTEQSREHLNNSAGGAVVTVGGKDVQKEDDNLH
jgi:hypothetical protein